MSEPMRPVRNDGVASLLYPARGLKHPRFNEIWQRYETYRGDCFSMQDIQDLL